MKLLRETIRRLLRETPYTSAATRAFVKELSTLTDHQTYDGYYFEVTSDHPNGCSSYLDMTIEDQTTVWLGNLATHGDQEMCSRKGYAKDMLSKVTKTADNNGITLELLSSSEDMNRISDAQLMGFYSQMGFEVIEDMGGTYGMRRLPLNNRGPKQ